MTDEQLIERIAEILFDEEEIDAWGIYDCLEETFTRQRPDLKKKYETFVKNEEIRVKEQELMELGLLMGKLQNELNQLKESV
jgi:hypothetical protein